MSSEPAPSLAACPPPAGPGAPSASVRRPGGSAVPAAGRDGAPVPTAPSAGPEPAVGRGGGPAVLLEGATRDFGEGAGIFDLGLAIPPGTILGVVGPSGAGKTTTVRLITGALRPDTGRVRILGEDPRRLRPRTRERIGYMPQLFSLYPDLTADENVDFVASLFGLLTPRRRRRVREALAFVDLWPVRRRRAGDLSGGMQRRLELACALVHEPDLLLLDEPTAGIDPLLRGRIWEELARLRDGGRTLLVTTQYVAEAERCDAVALVAEGRLAALGTPAELRRAAVGGDALEVTTRAPFDPEPLVGRGGILGVRSLGLRSFRVVADDAGTVLPAIDDLATAAGAEVTSVREVPPSFDEVFAALVARARGGAAEPAA